MQHHGFIQTIGFIAILVGYLGAVAGEVEKDPVFRAHALCQPAHLCLNVGQSGLFVHEHVNVFRVDGQILRHVIGHADIQINTGQVGAWQLVFADPDDQRLVGGLSAAGQGQQQGGQQHGSATNGMQHHSLL